MSDELSTVLEQRLADQAEIRRVLHTYDLMDSVPQKEFDDLVLLVAHRFGSARAQISIVSPERVWLLAATQDEGADFCPEDTLCAQVADDRRALVLPDTRADERYAQHPAVRAHDARFYLGVPLLTPEGLGIGALCVWDTEPRAVDEHDLRALQAAASYAMTLLDQRRTMVERDRDQVLVSATGQVLDLIVAGATLETVLDLVARSVEHALPATRASIHLLEGDTLHAVATPNLPDGYRQAAQEVAVGPASGSCGTAAHTRCTVIAADIATDARWAEVAHVALQYGLRSCWSVPVMDAEDEVLGTFALYGDVVRSPTPQELDQLHRWVTLTELAITRQRDLKALRRAATHDPLTGLANRREALDVLRRELAGGSGRGTGVLFLDLDQFRFVNDSYGHQVGDQFLRRAAARLADSVRGADTVARLGGDEFLVICRDVDSDAAAAALGRRVLASLNRPMTIDGRALSLSASVGVATTVGRTESWPEALIRDADLAMYAAKNTGRNSVAIFGATMRDRAAERLQLEGELNLALLGGELDCYYQPSIDLRSGRVRGVESLVRWHSPTRGTVAPDLFVTVAEESGLMSDIGEFVLRRSCTQLAAWRAENPVWADIRVWVNVSARQLTVATFPQTVMAILDDAGLPPECLGLEVTERSFMADVPSARDSLEVLRRHGVAVAIDDFGTGYSSLALLKGLPLDGLKIDRQFLADRAYDDIVEVIVKLAAALDIAVTAEGVEHPGQRTRLAALGCDYGQGYLWAEPLPADRIREFVERTAWSVATRSA